MNLFNHVRIYAMMLNGISKLYLQFQCNISIQSQPFLYFPFLPSIMRNLTQCGIDQVPAHLIQPMSEDMIQTWKNMLRQGYIYYKNSILSTMKLQWLKKILVTTQICHHKQETENISIKNSKTNIIVTTAQYLVMSIAELLQSSFLEQHGQYLYSTY